MLLVLDSTSRTLRAKMSDAPSSVQCSVTVTYADTTATTFVEGMYPIQLNGTTLVTILPAPAAGTRRVVKSVMFFNDDTMTHTITLSLTDNITDYPITKITLPPGSSWASDDQTGVNVGGAVTDGSKGDISVSNGGDTWTIANSAVTLAKMADLTASKLIGRESSGSGVPQEIGVTGGIEFTGTSIQVGAFSGDVAKTAGSASLTISNNAVTYAKMQDVSATSRVIGRKTALSGDPEECTLSEVLDFVGSAAQGDLLYRGASAWTRLGAGTSGQYLQTQGASANPQWASVTGGGTTFKNRLINGDFRVAQRGTSYTSTSLYPNNNDAYVLDRWYILSDGNAVIDVTQSTDVPTAPGALTSIALDVETISKKFGIAQIIENRNCADLIGGTVSLSFKAKVSNTILSTIKATVISWTGTADSVNSTFITTGWNAAGVTPTFETTNLTTHSITSFSPTTSWATYKIENVSLSSSAKNVIVFIWSDVLPSSTGHFLYITDVQLEAGATATAYERLPYDVQLAQCQRYFVSFGGNTGDRYFGGVWVYAAGVANWSTGVSVTQNRVAAWGYINYPVQLRKVPTGTTSNMSEWRGYLSKGNVGNITLSDLKTTQVGPVRPGLAYEVGGLTTVLMRMEWATASAVDEGQVAYLYPFSDTALIGVNGAEL